MDRRNRDAMQLGYGLSAISGIVAMLLSPVFAGAEDVPSQAPRYVHPSVEELAIPQPPLQVTAPIPARRNRSA